MGQSMRMFPVLIVISLLVIVPSVSDDSDADNCVIRLGAVYPTDGFEGFAIINYGRTTDLNGYSVTDGEGTVSFTQSFTIYREEMVYFCKTAPPSWLEMDRVVTYGQYGITMKGLALADSGDDIHLMKGDTLIDSFVYGSGTSSKGGWEGEAFPKITKNHIALRKSVSDTDTFADWTMTVPGRSNFRTDPGYDATVTPISFPDDYSSFFNALQGAGTSIDISVYILSHPRIVSSLLSSLDSGVTVRILVEGSPAGGMTTSEIKALKTLSQNGAEVKVMRQCDGYRAYSYIHNKYAVIDGTRTILTTENWQESSFTSNRGWGAVIESEGYSSLMERVFETDFRRSFDVVGFEELFPTAEIGDYEAYQPETSIGSSYKAVVHPVLSPDNSYDRMRSFITSAEERVYSEQLDVQYEWIGGDDNPISWMMGTSDDVDRRLLVDVTFDDRNDSDYKDGYGVIDALSSTSIRTRSPQFEGMTHNKGVIVDDRIWIGSVNWTYNSFKDNREVAVIIDSSEVTDYFVSLFMDDWEREEAIVEREYGIGVQSRGDVYLFEAEGVEGCVCRWDLDGDGVYDREGTKIVAEFGQGHHVITLCVDDGVEMKELTAEVDYREEKDMVPIPMKYYPIIVICALIIVFNIVRWVRGRDDPDKGFQRRGQW